MRGRSKIILAFVFLTAMFFSSFAFPQIQAQQQITADSIFPVLVYSTTTGPTSGEAVFVVWENSNLTSGNLMSMVSDYINHTKV